MISYVCSLFRKNNIYWDKYGIYDVDTGLMLEYYAPEMDMVVPLEREVHEDVLPVVQFTEKPSVWSSKKENKPIPGILYYRIVRKEKHIYYDFEIGKWVFELLVEDTVHEYTRDTDIFTFLDLEEIKFMKHKFIEKRGMYYLYSFLICNEKYDLKLSKEYLNKIKPNSKFYRINNKLLDFFNDHYYG